MQKIDSIWQCVCTLITHGGRQNVVRIKVTPLARFHVIRALSEYTPTSKWNLFIHH